MEEVIDEITHYQKNFQKEFVSPDPTSKTNNKFSMQYLDKKTTFLRIFYQSHSSVDMPAENYHLIYIYYR